MRKLTLRYISFNQDADAPEYIYALNEDRVIAIGDYYYNRALGRFACIQKATEKAQMTYQYAVIECSTNPDLVLPSIPTAFVKQYFESNKEKNILEIRL